MLLFCPPHIRTVNIYIVYVADTSFNHILVISPIFYIAFLHIIMVSFMPRSKLALS